jgi:hypothetical protein
MLKLAARKSLPVASAKWYSLSVRWNKLLDIELKIHACRLFQTLQDADRS